MITAMLGVAAEAKPKKKMSLADLAALEWKLEQGALALTTNPDAKARIKALADLAAIKDHRTAKPLARALKEDPEATVRVKAAEALADLRTPEAKGLLALTASSDPDAGVRGKAAALLKKFPRRMIEAALPLKPRPFKAPKTKKKHQITEKTLRAILKQPSGDARLWAIRQLKQVKVKDKAGLLRYHLNSDPSARVRIEAAKLLSVVQKSKSLPSLIARAADGNPRVRFEVARIIATFDDAGALKVLQQIAAEDRDRTVKADARDLLEPTTKVGRRLLRDRIKKLRSDNPKLRVASLNELSEMTHWRAMVPMSCTLLSDRSVVVRTAAAKVLTNLHDSSILTALRVAAVLEPDKRLKKLIRTLLTGMRKRVTGLIKQLGSKEAGVRVRAARALGQAAYPPGRDPLIATLKDKDPRVRLAAAHALTSFSDQKAITALKMAGSDASAKVRKVVDMFFKEQRRLEKYRKFFKDSNRVVMKTSDKSAVWRSDAAIALGIAGAQSAVGTLAQLLLHDKDETVRLAAAWSLVLMASERGEIALKKAAAKDKSQKVRLSARKYLIIDKVSLDDLIQQLESDDASVRLDAAEALSLQPRSKILNPMIRASLCDPAPRVRSAAMRALARLGVPIARTAMKVAISRDPSERVRRVAYMMFILAGGK